LGTPPDPIGHSAGDWPPVGNRGGVTSPTESVEFQTAGSFASVTAGVRSARSNEET
jgi:hypothetical protein